MRRIIPVWFSLLAVAPALAAEPKVEIVGRSPNGVLMEWTVTNRSTGRISQIDFPIEEVIHIQPPPEGWEIIQFDQWKKGYIKFKAKSRQHDLWPNQTQKFTCVLDRRRQQLRQGTVIVQMRDGSTIQVAGVTVPGGQSVLGIYAVPAFLAALFLIFVAVKTFRRKAKAQNG